MTQGGNEVGGHQRFRGWAGRASPWGVEGQGSTVAFGGQVLDDVTAGLRDFLETELWGRRRRPAVLGCSPWLTDREVIDELLRFSDSCIVINKPGLSASLPSEVRRLHRDGPGFALDALHEFETLARLDDGRPLVVGPTRRSTTACWAPFGWQGRGRGKLDKRCRWCTSSCWFSAS